LLDTYISSPQILMMFMFDVRCYIVLYSFPPSSIKEILSSIIPFFYSQSFYTCRCLLFDTYISSMFILLLFISFLPNIPCLCFTGILTPHVLSEWMVEV
jgi:hypothetical protein